MYKLKFSKFQIIFIFFSTALFYACGQSGKEEFSAVPKTVKNALDATVQKKTKSHPVTEKTRMTYQWYCAQCHGINGKGNGINSPHLTVPPRNHTKAEYLETRSDQELFNAISKGGLKVGRAPCMPAWGETLDKQTIWSLVRYIRQLCKCKAI